MNKNIAGRIINKVKRTLHPTKTVHSEYLNWLNFANAGMLNPGNIYSLDYAIKNIATHSPVLEIGSFCGLSTNVISYLLRKHGKKNIIISADKWIFEGSESIMNVGDSDVAHSDYKNFVKESFKRNVSFFSKSNLPYTIEAFSDEFFELWQTGQKVRDVFEREIQLDGKISLAYIDGNHTYEYAKRDFINTGKILEKGGFILFDDSYEGSPFGCARLMKEILADKNYRLVLKNPNYLFQKVT